MKLTAKFDNSPAKTKTPTSVRTTGDQDATPAARNLALAYHLDGLIERGLLADYSAAAKALGVSQPRLTHLMSLLLLAPTIQEAILAGTIAPGDKQLRKLARVAEWREQIAGISA